MGWQVQGLVGNDEWENIIFDKKRPVTFPTREAADEALGELLRRFFENAKKERMNADPIEMRVAEVTD